MGKNNIHVLVFILICIVASTQDNSLYCVIQESPNVTVECLNSIKESDIDNEELAYLLGSYCQDRKLFEKAYILYKIASQKQPYFIDAHYKQIGVLFQMNKFQEAIILEYQNLGKFSLAHQAKMSLLLEQFGTEHFQNYINLNTNDQKNIAISRYFLREFAKAQQLFKSITKKNSYSVFNLMFIRTLQKQQKYYLALQMVNFLLKHQPNNFYLHHTKGNLLMHHIKFNDAKIEFEKAIELNPLFFLSYYNLALCHQKLSEFNYSLKYLTILQNMLNRNIFQCPKGKVLNAIGFTYYSLQNYIKSSQYYQLAIRQNDEQKAIIYYNLGVLYYTLNKFQQALNYLDLSLSSSNNYQNSKIIKALCLHHLDQSQKSLQILNQLSVNYEAKYHQAYILYQLDRLEEALNTINQAIKLNPQYAVSYNCKAMIYFKKSQYQNAIQNFDLAIKLDVNNPQNYFNKAVCLSELGKHQQAITAFSKADELGYDTKQYIKQLSIKQQL